MSGLWGIDKEKKHLPTSTNQLYKENKPFYVFIEIVIMNFGSVWKEISLLGIMQLNKKVILEHLIYDIASGRIFLVTLKWLPFF